MEEIFVNKVANSGLVSLNLEDYYSVGYRVEIDVKELLFMGMVLKEKDFREFIKTNDWTVYQNKYVAIYCSTDAIVPTWAYMLLASALQPFAKSIYFGSMEDLEKHLIINAINQIELSIYKDQKIVKKGCGDIPISNAAYVQVTSLLAPIAKSIMYGEPCSTVPIMKRKD